jgi:hypothetical protein
MPARRNSRLPFGKRIDQRLRIFTNLQHLTMRLGDEALANGVVKKLR